MSCNVGETNPDIAGLGILISFAAQAGLSIILSCISLVLWKNLATSLLVERNPDVDRTTNSPLFSSDEDIRQLLIYADALLGVVRSKTDLEAQDASAKDARRALKRRISMWYGHGVTSLSGKKSAVDAVLTTISDVQILNALALLLAALIQWRSLSLYHLHIVYDTASFTGISACASFICIPPHDARRSRKLSLAAYVGIFTSFIAVLCIRLAQWDINKPGDCHISLTGDPSTLGIEVSYIAITAPYSLIAILICYRSNQTSPSKLRQKVWQPMARAIAKVARLLRLKEFFSGLSVFLTRVFTVKKPEVPITDISNLSRRGIFVRFISTATRIQVSVMFLPFSMVWALSRILVRGKPEEKAPLIAVAALIQGPLHLGVAIVLRIRNEEELEGDSESTWGFGQIIPLLLLAGTLIECVRGISDYRKAVKLKKNEEQEGNDQQMETFAHKGVQTGLTIVARRNSY
ncbi:hypothetical protein FDECE_9456 [Fusarium decemcellulare]|nr:hypothetical protein FDECE_9456 [Fusarium decemcellulare]